MTHRPDGASRVPRCTASKQLQEALVENKGRGNKELRRMDDKEREDREALESLESRMQELALDARRARGLHPSWPGVPTPRAGTGGPRDS